MPEVDQRHRIIFSPPEGEETGSAAFPWSKSDAQGAEYDLRNSTCVWCTVYCTGPRLATTGNNARLEADVLGNGPYPCVE